MKYKILGNYYNGTFHLPPVSGPLAVENIITRLCPADLSNKLWEAPVDYRDIDKVVESSLSGFKVWKKTSTSDRCNFLKKFQNEIVKRKDELSKAISYETGKPLWESRLEIEEVASRVLTVIEDALPRIANMTVNSVLPQTDGNVIFKPLGPSCIIGPFNSPLHYANGPILNSLIAGNSIIFKPSEKAAYSSQIYIECFHAASFPEGVINLIQGDGEVARRLVKEKAVKAVFFTGSKEVGKKVLETTHHDLSKLVSLELSGKNFAILNHDANLEYAMLELLKGSFLTAGQGCTSTSIIAIQKNIHEEFISKFHEFAKKIVIDHPVEYAKEPFMGPLIDQSAVDAYLLFMGMAKREGIQEIMRGKLIEKPKKGHYVSPSIHLSENWNNDSMFLHSEIMGPNVTFIPYDTLEDALKIANATEYGLIASVFTQDQLFYSKCLEELDFGMINLNSSTVTNSQRLPFGGIKNSGNYRPAGLTNVDSCVYQVSCLELKSPEAMVISSIHGIDL